MKYLLSILVMLATLSLSAQGIKDSVFHIETVEVSSKRNFLKEDAGMNETRIDTFILQKQSQQNLSDLLAENTSIYIKDYGRGALATAMFRGTAASHTQVQWNGMNINSPMLGMVDFSLIPVFIIDELKVQHGAASVSSQSGGLGGLIQIENNPNWASPQGGKIYADFGSFNTSNVYMQSNFGSHKYQSKTRFYFNRSKNNYLFLNKNIIEKDSLTGELFHPMQENKNAGYQKYGLTQEFYWRIRKQTILSNRTWFQEAERSIPTVLSSEYSDEILQSDNSQSDNTFKNISEFKSYWQNGSLTAMTGLDYHTLDYSFLHQVVGLEARKSVNSHTRMFNWNNRIELLHEFSEKLSTEWKGSLNRYDITTLDSAILTGYDTLRTESSIFAGAYYSPIERVQMSLQMRQDFIKGNKIPLIYSLGLSYKPLENSDIIFKGNVSRNYHQPTLNDLYWQPGGNPDLLPEQGYSAEAAIHYSAKINKLNIKTSMTGFYSKIEDWILWLPGFKGYWQAINIDEVRSYGLEYQLSMYYTINSTELRFFGNLALTNTLSYNDLISQEASAEGTQLPFIPKVSGNAFFSVKNHGFYLLYQNNSMSKRSLISSNIAGLEDDSEILSQGADSENMHSLYPHYLNKVRIGKEFYPLFGKLVLELSIDNIFNESYRNILNRFMPGRSYTLTLKIDF